MRATKMTQRPDFSLMKQTDIQSVYHMQMPRWLFSDPRYADMSLDAKVTYTFLLNRFQLSRRNGWVNEYGEVFVIFPRKALAKELRICEQRVTAAFRKLAELHLIWEKRCGRGDANQIYLASVTPLDDPSYECAPFHTKAYEACGSRTADPAPLAETDFPEEPQDLCFQTSGTGSTRPAEPAPVEPQEPGASNTEREYLQSDMEVSLSVSTDDGTDDEKTLTGILVACELSCFSPELAMVFEDAIERMFYAQNLRVDNAILPQSRVRARMRRLDCMVLQEAANKLAANLERPVKNSTAYVMTTIYNCITEYQSDLLVDPYLNSLRQRAKGGG